MTLSCHIISQEVEGTFMICISLSLSAFVFPLQLIFFLSEKRLFTMSTLCEYIGRVAVGDDCSLLLSLHHFSPRLCLAPSRRRARAAHPDTPSPERQTDRQAGKRRRQPLGRRRRREQISAPKHGEKSQSTTKHSLQKKPPA